MSQRVIWVGLGISLCLLVGAKISLEKRIVRPTPRTLSLTPVRAAFQSKFLKRMHIGFNSVIADLLWIQFLQVHQHVPLKRDSVSWEFVQLDSVTRLEPRFQRAFHYGAILLSVLRQDKLGAKLILERWVRARPNYWRSNFLYGYHLYFELGEFKTASKYILRASEMKGAPFWLSSLGVRLLSESGSLIQVLKVTIDLFNDIKVLPGKERLARRIRSINYALQKIIWEKKNLTAKNGDNQEHRELSSILISEAENRDIQILLGEKFNFYLDPASGEVKSRRSMKELDIDRIGIYRPKGMPQ